MCYNMSRYERILEDGKHEKEPEFDATTKEQVRARTRTMKDPSALEI